MKKPPTKKCLFGHNFNGIDVAYISNGEDNICPDHFTETIDLVKSIFKIIGVTP